VSSGDRDLSSSGCDDVEPLADPAPLDELSRAWGERILARRSLLIGGLVAVAAPIGMAALFSRRATGDIAPGFALDDLADDAERVSLSNRSGGPALVNFWASWCVPCRTEMPVLGVGFVRFGDRVLFIGVDHQDSRSAAQAFVVTAGARYRSGFDPDGTVGTTYGIRGLPTTVLIAADGRLVETVTGALTEARLERLLADGLGSK
jgi:cytochrome c biogenesis protein CcmG/thiol:disulfide interchange protein DsbE